MKLDLIACVYRTCIVKSAAEVALAIFDILTH